MSQFEMLLACYHSGQMSQKQWVAHCADAEFSAWLENQKR